MESEMRLGTMCSIERAPKQFQFACMFDAPHKKNINKTKIQINLKSKQKTNKLAHA